MLIFNLTKANSSHLLSCGLDEMPAHFPFTPSEEILIVVLIFYLKSNFFVSSFYSDLSSCVKCLHSYKIHKIVNQSKLPHEL